MAKPKLALIPASQGTKLYSVLPADGVGDFNFSRNTVATRINKDGLIETVASGVSRLNYPLIDGVVNGCPSHLLEPSRINRVPFSEDINNSAWSKLNITVSPNSIISPSGLLNADLITENTVNGQHRVIDVLTLTSGVAHTISAFIKPNGSKFARLRLENAAIGSGQINVFFDLENGVVSSGNGSIEEYPNGWYRLKGFGTTSGATNVIYVALANADGAVSYQGDGVSGAYVWGVQAEQGSYPTSYIPNYGTAAGVTRSSDTANGAGDASTFNDSEGVLMAEISALADDGTSRRISVTDAIGNDFFNLVSIELDESSAVVKGFVSNGSTVDVLQSSLTQTLFNKIALKYNSSSISLFINGFEVASDNSPNLPSGLKELTFTDGKVPQTRPFYGNTKQLQYFDSALNDSDLETITSWTSFTDLANGQLYSIK